MKKLIIILLLFSISVFAIENNYFSNKVKTIPLTLNFLSSENGGELTAIDAYSDGVGLFILGEDKRFLSMNELVFKYGEKAKINNETL